MTRIWLVAFISVVAGACENGPAPEINGTVGAHGTAQAKVDQQSQGAFDYSQLSTTIKPQDDFWGYVNQSWIDATEIPADRSSYGSFHVLGDRTEEQIKVLVEQSLSAGAKGTFAERTIGNLYGSFVNEAAVEKLGMTPIAPYLEQIDAVESYRDLAQVMGEFSRLGVNGPVGWYADNDAYDASRLIMYLWQAGLGLPNRDYYLDDNPKLVSARKGYVAHIERMYDVAGWLDGDIAAKSILELETRIAQRQWTAVQNRDRQTIYSNQLGLAAAEAATGKFALGAWLTGLGVEPPQKLVLAQASYFAALNELVTQTELPVWRHYLKFHLLKTMAPYLHATIADEDFAFDGRELRGQETQQPRWRRGVRLINRTAGELLGRVYVETYFPEAAKAQIGALVENLRVAYAQSIQQLEWMSEETKAQALIKLEGFLPKLGYPDTWRDFSGLKTQPDSLVANIAAANQFNSAYQISRLNVPVDRGLWTTNPQTVNAFYRPTHNSITFPAGILQPPFFSPTADPAMNYGAIGSVIGHEFSHGFDDQGRKFDGTGLLRNWWTAEDAAKYEARSQVIVDQYNAFHPLPDTAINGRLTLGENIGDLAGVLMAFAAFELSGHADGPELNGLSPRQRFFISYALAFRSKVRGLYLRELLLRDNHSPGEFRVTGVLRNVPGFYAAFGVSEGDGMFLPAEQRAKIW